MVHAGEQSGTLEQVLGRLADFMTAQNRLRGKVMAAMAYPAIMALMGVIIITVMMVVVVPKMTSIFQTFGKAALPLPTRMLIATSEFMQHFWWALLSSLCIGKDLTYKFMDDVTDAQTAKGEFKWHGFVLRAPIFGKLTMMIAVSRFTKTLSTLLKSGVPLLTAMDITKGVLGNAVLQKIIVDASSSIREGESIADPLKASGKFPPLVTHMIAVGERSGQLEEMLENVALSYDSQVENRVAALTSLLEPLMIVIMGLGAGSIAVAILMPLMKMSEFVQ